MDSASRQEILSSVDLPPDTRIEDVGGATGRSWKAHTSEGPFSLRLATPASTDWQLAAMTAARDGGVPVPAVLHRRSTSAGDVLLVEWSRGKTLADTLFERPDRARKLGVVMGAAQQKLHEIPAPPGVKPVESDGRDPGGEVLHADDKGVAVDTTGQRLLHLDWHPLNLLFDGDELTAVIDWENARAGAPTLDLARTYSILTIDPAVATFPEDVKAAIRELLDGWQEGHGVDIPPASHAWAGHFMLDDRAQRPGDTPEALEAIRQWTADWERRATTDSRP